MDYKNSIGDEIKSIFEEETEDIKLSSKTLNNILGSRKLSLREKINNFLNREVEVPLTPAILGFVLILGLSIFPKEFPSRENVEIINIGGSQIIMRNENEVSRKWNLK